MRTQLIRAPNRKRNLQIVLDLDFTLVFCTMVKPDDMFNMSVTNRDSDFFLKFSVSIIPREIEVKVFSSINVQQMIMATMVATERNFLNHQYLILNRSAQVHK